MISTTIAFTWTIGIPTTCLPLLFINKAYAIFYHFLAIWSIHINPTLTKISNHIRSVTHHTYNTTSQLACFYSIKLTFLIIDIAYPHNSNSAPLCKVAIVWLHIDSYPTSSTTPTHINTLPITTTNPTYLQPLIPSSQHYILLLHKYMPTHMTITLNTYPSHIILVALPLITPSSHTYTALTTKLPHQYSIPHKIHLNLCYIHQHDFFPSPTSPTHRTSLNAHINRHMLTSTPPQTNLPLSILHAHSYTLHTCPLHNLLPPRTSRPPSPPHTHNTPPPLPLTTNHHNPLHLLLLLCGDIHPNPGPMPNLIHTHPSTHKRRQTTYFLPSTIKFHPEYQHIADTFQPLLQNTHHLHAQIILSLPYLYTHIQRHNNHPPPTDHIRNSSYD